MSLRDDALSLHREFKGKLEIMGKVPVNDIRSLSLAYTPGVAEPCKEIALDEEKVYEYTAKGNMVAVVTDGTAVLGLGDIGPHAALPVMEGKAVLFKDFGGVDAFPICLNTKDTNEIVRLIQMIAPSFGGINLEDISAPRCFEIEEELKKSLSIPVFHDDQHGTAIVVLAALMNTLRLIGKQMQTIRVVINGAGAAGIAIAKMLLNAGVEDMLLLDKQGILCEDCNSGLNWAQIEMSKLTNRSKIWGNLSIALKGADVFIGVSKADVLHEDLIRSMAKDPVVFAMANPNPEIKPELAKKAGAAIVGTGRSDYPNQINNVLAFPGVFRGALDARAKQITEKMKIAAAGALSKLIMDEELSAEYIIPKPFDKRVSAAVAQAVAQAALAEKAE
ncbi:MAG: NADP-dependent malic enzyme [Firmicutes bacterium]|nr:NADP-dependent malic enzyme [Bacillota bacterium]